MTLAELAAEIERLDAKATPGPWHVDVRGLWSSRGTCLGYIEEEGASIAQDQKSEHLVVFLRNHAAQIAAALRLLERANDTIVTDGLHGNKAWKDDYRALAGGEG